MSCGEWPVIAERRCFLLSTMAADAGGEVGGGGLFFAKLLGPFLHVLALPLRQHAASPTRRRAGSPIPKARRQGGGRGGRVRQEAPPLPGLAAVGWSRRKRLALSGAGPRSAQGAVARAAALATVPRQGGTPSRTGGRSAPDRPRAPSRLTLRQRKAPSRDADCLRGQPRLRLVSQAPRQRRFSGIVGCGTPQEAR